MFRPPRIDSTGLRLRVGDRLGEERRELSPPMMLEVMFWRDAHDVCQRPLAKLDVEV